VASTERRLSGKAKAAILLSTLGADVAANLLGGLRDREIETLAVEIGKRTRVSKDQRRAVLQEFAEQLGGGDVSGDGGMDFARDVLVKAKGEDGAAVFLKKIEAAMTEPGFEGLNDIDASQLVNMIRNEHPQTIAVILSHLKPGLAGQVLQGLPRDTQPDVTRRMARFNRVSTEMLKDVEQVLNQNFFLMDGGKSEMGGPKAVAEVLNTVDGTTEKHILGTLEESVPQVVEEIRKHMFVFEDIKTLTDKDVQRVLKEVQTKTISLALKAASDIVKERFMKNMSSRAQETLKEEIQMLGPVRLRVVEEAQGEIVDLIRRLESAGEITLERGGAEDEDVLI
jgi:flagellar motor switch protein FliG